jgi:hypothetical protein
MGRLGRLRIKQGVSGAQSNQKRDNLPMKELISPIHHFDKSDHSIEVSLNMGCDCPASQQ